MSPDLKIEAIATLLNDDGIQLVKKEAVKVFSIKVQLQKHN